MVKTREERIGSGHGLSAVDDAPNYGAINGFPIEIKFNNESYGLYTMNIPKDEWMFSMNVGSTGDDTFNAGVSGELNESNICKWMENMPNMDSGVPEGFGDFEVEFKSKDKGNNIVLKSLGQAIAEVAAIQKYDNSKTYSINNMCVRSNQLYVCTSNTTGEFDSSAWSLVEGATDPNSENYWENLISDHVDIDSVYDYFIFTICANNNDALARNILYFTFGGTKWHMSAYDLDTTFGYNPYANVLFSVDAHKSNERCSFIHARSMNNLEFLISTLGKAKLKDRYNKLRNGYIYQGVKKPGLLSDAHVFETLTELGLLISENAYRYDRERWKNELSTGVVNIPQFMEFYRMHCAYLDQEVAELG